MKHFIEVLEKGRDPRHGEILASISPETLRVVDDAMRIDWLPIEVNFEATRAVTRALGVHAGEHFFYRMYAELFDGPIFSALMRGIRAMGATSPGAYLKHGGRGYVMVFRGVGHIEVGQREPNAIHYDFHDLPVECFEPELSWVRYSGATYLSAFDFTDTRGDMEIVEEAPERGYARIRFAW